MRRLIIIGVLIAVVGGAFWGISLYNKPHKDLNKTSPTYTLTSEALFTDYSSDEENSNEKYLNEILQITGTVKQKTPTENGGYVLILSGDDMFGINCAFQPEEVTSLEQVNAGDKITVKGICSGMLMDVNLSRCTLVH